jgi:hypothetical protein
MHATWRVAAPSKTELRALSLYEYARNLAGRSAKQDRATLIEPIRICTQLGGSQRQATQSYDVAALRQVLYLGIEYLHHTL